MESQRDDDDKNEREEKGIFLFLGEKEGENC
jgi:hypothetical protein